MIGKWEVPCIEHIGTVESRRLARVPIPGLQGDLHQDLGADSLAVEIRGSLAGDQTRDDFLKSVRDQFHAGQPVTFVADILTATALDKVVIEALEVEERNDAASSFSYRIVLREYVEPPAPPGALDDLGAGLEGELGDAAKLGLDGLELPGILGSIPDIGDPKPPLQAALDGVKAALGGLTKPLKDLATALSGTATTGGATTGGGGATTGGGGTTAPGGTTTGGGGATAPGGPQPPTPGGTTPPGGATTPGGPQPPVPGGATTPGGPPPPTPGGTTAPGTPGGGG